jgi:predicted amidophosphoribosyltransferase
LFPERLTWLDEVRRGDHRFLGPTDHCLYFGEFHAGGGWTASPTNDLIIDFKRSPSDIAASAKSHIVQRFKERALATVAGALRRQFGRAAIETLITFVPIPPSKRPGDPDHCDRLQRTLRLAFEGLSADVRPLLRQRVSTHADHLSGGRRTRFGELLEITELDAAQLVRPLRPLVALFDDVLTSGKHLAVARLRIRESFPDQAIIAVLIARRVRQLLEEPP